MSNNIKFLPILERHEPPITDSSMASTFKKCPRMYFYHYVLGLVKKYSPAYINFGSSYHKFREVLELTQSFEQATFKALELFKNNGGDPPIGTQYDFLSSLRLIKSCTIAYKHWQAEKSAKIIEVITVEQAFNIELPDETRTSGRLDQVVKWNGKIWGRDFKTSTKMGKMYERSLEPNDQFSRYIYSLEKLSNEIIGGIVVEVLYNTKKDGPQIMQFLSTRSRTQIAKWCDDQAFWNMFLETCRVNDSWPMNESQCWNCDYHSVCKSPTEGTMVARLKNDYVTRPWDNTKTDD